MTVKELRFEWKRIICNVPRSCGLYTVWAGDKLLYIGTSKYLSERLESHNKRDLFMMHGATRVLVQLLPKHQQGYVRFMMEKWLIRRNRPMLQTNFHIDAIAMNSEAA